MMIVKTLRSHYLVTVATRYGLQQFHVTRDKTCSCGEKCCCHVSAVASYLKAGGARPDDRVIELEPDERARVCPICSEPIISAREPRMWSCSVGGFAHFFEWYGETVLRGKVRRYFTEDRENRIVTFTPEELEKRRIR